MVVAAGAWTSCSVAIERVIAKLGIASCAGTLVGHSGAGTSGGERKRSSLASELLSNQTLLPALWESLLSTTSSELETSLMVGWRCGSLGMVGMLVAGLLGPPSRTHGGAHRTTAGSIVRRR